MSSEKLNTLSEFEIRQRRFWKIKSTVAAIFADCRLFAYNLRVSWFQNIFNKMALGDYPAEYNPKVHGPYDPARFYGKGTIQIYL